jgi:dTDP-L-rhamnose 4-epimerase
MKVLVTGGAGFIGSHVVEMLEAAGHDVVVLDVRPTDGGLTGDVRDPEAVARALTGVDAVCHQAAMVGLGVNLDDLPEYVGRNDLGTAVLLAGMARAGVRRLVLASSMVVYGEGRYRCPRHGDVAPPPRTQDDLAAGRFEPPCPVCGAPLEPDLVTEDARLDPRNVYAATKVAQEHLAASWARASGGTVAALRYHNVYGARMPQNTPYAGVASLFRSALVRGEAPRVLEDGGQQRDFVHVHDVARANVLALRTAGPAGDITPVNVCSGTPHTVGDLAEELARACAGPAPQVVGGARPADVRHVVADPARARELLGFTAEIGFAEGIADFATAKLRAPV